MCTRAIGAGGIAIFLILVSLGCGEEDPIRPDRIPPGAVGDLAVVESSRTSILLGWTATGDDGTSGTARSYDLRYSSDPWTDDSWMTARRAAALPLPRSAGEPEVYLLDDLEVGTSYQIALQVVDDEENRSPLSNRVEAATSTREGEDRSWWDGFSEQGMNDAVYALALFEGSVVAGGAFTGAGGTEAHHVASWSGTSWDVLGFGTDAEVFCFAQFEGALVAGGAFLRAGDVLASHVASWDGSQWRTLGEGMNHHVLSLVEWNGGLVAGGLFTEAGGDPASYLAAWDGESWESIPGLDAQVYALGTFQGDLIVGGRFERAGEERVGRLARWDGQSWHAIGGGLYDSPSSPSVSALLDRGGNLVVGGYFRGAGDFPTRNVASWDGAVWDRFGEGMDDGVRAFAEFGGLLAGGSFLSTSDGPMQGIARWEVGRWFPLASGLGDGFVTVHTLLVHEGSLYVGGLFDTAGGKSSANIARWDDPGGAESRRSMVP